MDNQVVYRLARSRVTVIPLAAIAVALAVLSLAILASAAPPPVSVEKTANPGTAAYGGIVKYTAVFSNSSASDVNLEMVTDTLPTGFTFLSMGTESQITHYPDGITGPIVWDQEAPYVVPAHGTLTLAYNVRVTAIIRSTPYLNRVEARLSTGEIISDTAPVTMIGPDLAGSKTPSSAQVRTGSLVDYTVTLSNIGVGDAVLSGITDTLPSVFAFRQMVSGPLPAPTVQGQELIWTGPFSIAEGGSLQFTYRVLVGGVVGQTYKNSLRAAYDGQVSDPFVASVTLLPCLVHLPLVVKIESEIPTSVYVLAFDSNMTDNFEIWTIKADGSEPAVNVSDMAGGDTDAVWSADGTRIAWVHYYDGKGDVVAADADGSNWKNLTNHTKDDRSPTWSPDGSKIAFASHRDDRWEVYAMDADGTDQTRLTSHECQSHSPTWSPAGNKIAYVCGIDAYAEVYVMDANGANAVRLTNNTMPDEALAWSPDGTQIAYVRFGSAQRRDSEIYVVTVSNGINTRLTYNAYADYTPDWSPDGTQIAFSTYLDGSYEIATMNADGSNVVNVTQTGAGIADYVPKWSPDGLMISFISNRDGNKELYVMEADGSDQLRLTNTGTDESNHDWKPQ